MIMCTPMIDLKTIGKLFSPSQLSTVVILLQSRLELVLSLYSCAVTTSVRVGAN